MTEQNEDAPIMQATLELPEGDVYSDAASGAQRQ